MKTYQITFKADLTEEDVRAMKKCFYDTMNESMEIENVWGLEIKPLEDDRGLTQLLKKGFEHISEVVAAFDACLSKADVTKVIKSVPAMFGTFIVEFNDEERNFVVDNTFYDDDIGDVFDESFYFEYPDNWVDEEDE
jgi:hypothetical protein